jgi:CoA:oxalate CoA-transferase
MMSTEETEDDALSLAGLRVLDLSQGIAGPYCGLILRQQGADVIKVEPPQGDWSRGMGRQKEGMSAIFAACNAGKQGVCLDTRTEQGRLALQALAQSADIVIQNYRPGVAQRMGAGWEQLSQQKPSLVYVSISGWGGTGPMAHVPTLDTTMQAASGMMAANKGVDGKPHRIGLYLIDYATGLYAAQGVMAALLRKSISGRGKHVQVAMLQTAAALQSYLVLDAGMFAGQSSAVFNAPTGLFDTQDKQQIYISMLNDAMFLRLAHALAQESWMHDTELHHSGGRLSRVDALTETLRAAIAQQPLAYWVRVLADSDVLFAPLRTAAQLPSDSQAQHLGIYQEHPLDGFPSQSFPVLPGEGAASAQLSPAPQLGQHTQKILAEMQLSHDSGPH